VFANGPARLRALLDSGQTIVVGDAVVGAIGVSGGHYSQDMEVAKAGPTALDSS
jgi:uncharacterized protein GlcG (DUF336 family)